MNSHDPPEPEGSSQGQSIDRLEVLRNDYEKRSKVRKGRVRIEIELGLEQTQQGSSGEVSVSTEGVEELKRIEKRKCEKK
jgi:putative component of toxin-antitoxin plasmid stabilization module